MSWTRAASTGRRALGAVLVLAVSCGLGARTSSGDSDACEVRLEYAGAVYTDTTDEEPRAGDELGSGAWLGCADTGGEPAAAEPVTVFAATGHDPDEAVVVGTGEDALLLVRTDDRDE